MPNKHIIAFRLLMSLPLWSQNSSELFPTAAGSGLSPAGIMDTAPVGQSGLDLVSLSMPNPDALLADLAAESPVPPPPASPFQLVTGVSPLNPDPTAQRFGSGLPIRLPNMDMP